MKFIKTASIVFSLIMTSPSFAQQGEQLPGYRANREGDFSKAVYNHAITTLGCIDYLPEGFGLEKQIEIVAKTFMAYGSSSSEAYKLTDALFKAYSTKEMLLKNDIAKKIEDPSVRNYFCRRLVEDTYNDLEFVMARGNKLRGDLN